MSIRNCVRYAVQNASAGIDPLLTGGSCATSRRSVDAASFSASLSLPSSAARNTELAVRLVILPAVISRVAMRLKSNLPGSLEWNDYERRTRQKSRQALI